MIDKKDLESFTVYLKTIVTFSAFGKTLSVEREKQKTIFKSNFRFLDEISTKKRIFRVVTTEHRRMAIVQFFRLVSF